MNSTSLKIKRFLSNRNTVTIICAIIGVVVLFVGYNLRVQSAIDPVKVPYAKVTIQPRTKIEDDMIGYIDVASAAVDKMGGNLLICEGDKCKGVITGRYSNVNTLIPQGSLFYESAVVDKSSLPDAAVYDTKEGETLYYLNVNMSTSYVNSIVPNGYIDLYVRTTDNLTGEVRVGKFIDNIKVLAVKTSDGLNVFENSDEQRVPSYIIFAVPAEQHIYLLMAAELGLSIIPVPINVDLQKETPDSSAMTSSELTAYIDTLASEFLQDDITLDGIKDPTDDTKDESKDNTKDDTNTKDDSKTENKKGE